MCAMNYNKFFFEEYISAIHHQLTSQFLDMFRRAMHSSQSAIHFKDAEDDSNCKMYDPYMPAVPKTFLIILVINL